MKISLDSEENVPLSWLLLLIALIDQLTQAIENGEYVIGVFFF